MKISAPGLELEVSAVSQCTDEGWCQVHVEVAVPGFVGDFQAQLQGSDLSRFAREIDNLYAAVGRPGVATLSSHEPGIEISLTMQKLGSIAGAFRLESHRVGGEGTVLSGPFEIDQSFLPALGSSVARLFVDVGGENEA